MNYVGMVITRELSVRDSNGDLTDAPDLTFTWRLGENGDDHEVTPSNISTGIYEASFIVEEKEGGLVYYRWDTEGDADIAKEGKLFVKPSVFEV